MSSVDLRLAQIFIVKGSVIEPAQTVGAGREPAHRGLRLSQPQTAIINVQCACGKSCDTDLDAVQVYCVES